MVSLLQFSSSLKCSWKIQLNSQYFKVEHLAEINWNNSDIKVASIALKNNIVVLKVVPWSLKISILRKNNKQTWRSFFVVIRKSDSTDTPVALGLHATEKFLSIERRKPTVVNFLLSFSTHILVKKILLFSAKLQ